MLFHCFQMFFVLWLTNHLFIFNTSPWSKWLPGLFLACLFEWRVAGDCCLLPECTSLQSMKGSTSTRVFHLPEELAANTAQAAAILHCVRKNTISLHPSLCVWLFSTCKTESWSMQLLNWSTDVKSRQKQIWIVCNQNVKLLAKASNS